MSNTIGLLNDQQQNLVAQLTSNLHKDQLLWLSGYLAGLGASPAELMSNASAQALGRSKEPLTILFGTHTGHSEEIAEQVRQQAESAGFEVEVEIMEDYNRNALKDVKNLLVIVSTHGEGDPPLSALDFLEYVQGDRVPKLENLNFSVLALGDKSYKKFCQTGIDFKDALLKAGAREILPIVTCDVDYQADAESWKNNILDELKKSAGAGLAVASTAVKAEPTTAYNRQNPFKSKVLEKIKLSGRDSNKEVYHFEFALDGSDLTYEPGDTVGIYATNPNDLVTQILAKLNLSGDESVNLKDGSASIKEALLNHLEITVLTKAVLQNYAQIVNNDILNTLLQEETALDEYLYGHDFLDLLNDFSAPLEAGQLVDVLRELPARMYSIASSQAISPEELHITVSAVRYDKNDRKHHGACSTYLIDQLNNNDELAIFVEKNRGFKLPAENETPVIMVGAGTGVAPYRGFIQQRQKNKAKGESWLVFGDQHFYSDFLYQVEWQKYLQKGILKRIDVAFSRDQEEKIYVQHKLKENSAELYRWLQKGAVFYVCGDKNNMAKDVHKTLLDIVSVEGGKSLEEAELYLTQLKKERRYQLDVY